MSIEISVVIPTYNHEKYIEQAINSVLMQKVNFEMEVLIGEDCSTDNTRSVLKRIEKTLPSYFHIFYREKNLNGGNFDDLFSRMKGKYFIILEGDDYWTYEFKLQREYDFLEAHREYVAVAHNVQVVNEMGCPIDWHVHECKKEEYTIKDFEKGLFPGQTASVLRKNYFYFDLFDYNIEVPADCPGDRVKAFLMAANGKVHCIQEKWSAYRLVLSHGSSYAASAKYSFQSKLEYHYALYKYAKKHVNIEVLKVAEEMYFWYLFACMMKGKCGITIKVFGDKFAKASFKGNVLFYVLKKLVSLPYEKVMYRNEINRRNAAIERSFKDA